MNVELVYDASYHMRGLGFISFQMPSSDFIELDDVLFVLVLKNKIILVSCMLNIQCRVSFEGYHCTIIYCSLASPRTLDIPMLDGGLYKFLIDIIELIH